MRRAADGLHAACDGPVPFFRLLLAFQPGQFKRRELTVLVFTLLQGPESLD
ncbi:hypothetical protein [Deinococcus sp. RM]|uniref:hypothetical protein n=1 Tax=Deinococcus sp. RM TaxID=2316359 RepID=UPI0013148EB9|nr:hypothetical protein [Deinococcus sp. RM]